MNQSLSEKLQSHGIVSIFEKSATLRAKHHQLQILKNVNSQDSLEKVKRLHEILSVALGKDAATTRNNQEVLDESTEMSRMLNNECYDINNTCINLTD